ncbi:hypothetical protein FQN57_003912 [Myotisia sp. PD_48]|nr:hypothetical protein FQN57_003912 [Myotisia sp. PD_48]
MAKPKSSVARATPANKATQKSDVGTPPSHTSKSDAPSSPIKPEDGPAPKSSFFDFIKAALMGAIVVGIAGIYSHLSQLTLHPVYGSVPPAKYHGKSTFIAALVGWIGASYIRRYANPRLMLPVLAFNIPTIQYLLFPLSSQLGAVYGPVVTEALTYCPLVALSVCMAGMLLEDLQLSQKGKSVLTQWNFVGSYGLILAVEDSARAYLSRHLGSTALMSTPAIQFILAAIHAVVFPSKKLLLVIPSLIFSATLNYHIPLAHTTNVLNARMENDGFALLHRQESVTGYLSVLENTKLGYRVMRCDHSLLGGEWALPPEYKDAKVRDSVFSVFTTLEAVRLVKKDDGQPRKPDAESNALIIGLGIGTTPTALAAHGINTTTVEIDPAVHQLAMDYFNYPRHLKTVTEDALLFVHNAKLQSPTPRYDFIVHDVFTGGVEPIDLFTSFFMQGLYDLLTDDGAIVINYAGDLALPTASLVVRTIKSVFPSCRIFRDHQQREDAKETDYANMVIYCKRTSAPLEFREPIEADYLNSPSRKDSLMPVFEVDSTTLANAPDGDQSILGPDVPEALQDWQAKGALGHWKVMRGVLPDGVWEKW